MPKAAVAPSAKWNSTYGGQKHTAHRRASEWRAPRLSSLTTVVCTLSICVPCVLPLWFCSVHYKNPAKRFSRNHEYWLRKASERAAASQQLAVQGLELEPRSHTFRSPSLALAFNQPIRNPSSLERSPSRAGAMPGDTRAGSLTARPLAMSIRETSVRSHNSFDASRSQSFYGQPYNVSALAMLEGQAAATHNYIPNQATVRPHVERNYRATGAGHQPPMAQRPQTARASYGSQSLQYQQPQYLENRNPVPSYGLYATLSPQNTWTDAPPTQRPVQAESSSALWQQTRPAAGLTQRGEEKLGSPSSSSSPSAVLARSHAFRPQLSTSQSSPTIPANLLLNVAASPERTQKRAAEWQGGAYQEMEL